MNWSPDLHVGDAGSIRVNLLDVDAACFVYVVEADKLEEDVGLLKERAHVPDS